MKAKAALLAALVLAILAALAVRQYVQDKERSIYAGQKPIRLLVAARNIDDGEVITGPALTIKEFPKAFLPPDAITSDDRATVTGKKATRNIRRGDPIQWNDLLEKTDKDDGLQSLLAIGERAITVGVSQTTSVGGMIRPGDRVDLYATFSEQLGAPENVADAEAANAPEFKVFTRQVLRSVLVLATGQKLNKKEIPMNLRFRAQKEEFSSLTLSVSSLEAGLILHAQQTGGRLTTTLRNREDIVDSNRIPDIDGYTFWDLVKEADLKRQERLNKLIENNPDDPLDSGL